MRKEIRKLFSPVFKRVFRKRKKIFLTLVCIVFGGCIVISMTKDRMRNKSGETGDAVEESNIEKGAKEYGKEKTTETAGTTETEETEEDFASLQKVLPDAEESLLTEEEKKQLEKEALEAAGQVKEVYQDIELEEGPSFASNIKEFTGTQCKEAVLLLGQAGFTSVTDGCNMENPEMAGAFYESYLEKRDAEFTVFDIKGDGLISVKTLICRKGKLQIYYIEIGWKEGGVPEIRDTSLTNLEEVKLTEKGYFIYTYENIMPHSSLRLYWRVKPLSDKYRELTEKYVTGLSYVNYNVLVTDWDGSNVEDILMPCMFEDIYRIDTGENLRPENGMIPAELYERIMTAYFPVTTDQLRRCCGYDKKSDTYPYEMILGRQYPPFGEVTGYTENADGTITLTVDGIWPDYNSDCAFTNTIVIKPFADGTFRYLSNSIEERELTIPSVAEKKDYDIPVSEREQMEAENDCNRMMELVSAVYNGADREDGSDVILSDEEIFQMQDRIEKTGCPVITAVVYSNMENYEKADDFLRACEKGKSGSLVIYRIRYDGGVGRNKFIFSGKDMYVLTANAVWNADDKPKISYISCAKIGEWKYTKRGWFCYKMCVPEYPEVTEIVDGSCLIRVIPMTERARELSEKCVRIPGYRGNNLLCSDWDEGHMDQLDYNGLYEYLYEMKYQEEFPAADYRGGIPAEEFESLIMEYLPVSAEQIRAYAVFDEKEQVYRWISVRGGSYVLSFFEMSLPDVTDIKENGDGTVTLTVCAVCDTVICDDAVITHELTVRFGEDGSFQYLGNKILNGGMGDMPEYQYRVKQRDRTEI